jgi:hypothetical protein
MMGVTNKIEEMKNKGDRYEKKVKCAMVSWLRGCQK